MVTDPNDPANNIPGSYQRGLTKLEYFTAKAMQGLLASGADLRMNWIQLSKTATDIARHQIKALNEHQ